MTFRRARLAAAVLIAGAASNAFADQPTYYQVVALPADDELAVRAEPAGDAEQIGALAGRAGPIEVLDVVQTGSTDWAEVVWQDTNAWIAYRFLDPITPETVGDTALPVGMICAGAEPFWGVTLISQHEAEFNSPMSPTPETLAIDYGVGAAARQGAPALIMVADIDAHASLFVTPARCSDGMSDRSYGWSAAYHTSVNGEPILYQGCCWLDATQ